MDQAQNLSRFSATAGRRHQSATVDSEGLIVHQEDCELSQQDRELYHPRDDVAESHDYGHKRPRLDGIDHTSATWHPSWDVLGELNDVNTREDIAIHRETNELILRPVHLSSQPSNNDPSCILDGQNSNSLSNTAGAIVSTDGIKISNVCLLNSPRKNNPEFKIIIKCGIKNDKAPTSADGKGKCDNDRVIWNEPFVFPGGITDGTLLTFTVRKKQFPMDITISAWERRAIDLFEMQSNFGSCKLGVSGESQLTFNVEKISELNVALRMVEQASTGLRNLPNLEVPAQTANFISSAAKVYNNNEKTWISFLDTFQVFMKVMDNVSQINIYAQAAWSVLSVIPKILIAKKNRDEKVKQLGEKLKDVYEYVMHAEWFTKLAATQSTIQSTYQTAILSTLVQQTIECAYFIREYTAESTVKNIVKAIGGSVDAKIQAFNDKLDHLKMVMTDSVNLDTSITTLRVSGAIAGLNEHILLGDIPYDSGAGYFPNKECLPGTRQTLINEIYKWANDDSTTQILVLSGQAGIGKSAIAHTIAKMLKDQNRLGSMFCFSQGYPGRRNRLFSTISRDLADGDSVWRKELVKVISNNSAVRKKEDVRTQFEELVIKPSQEVATIGPVVVVVDALDESGDREERKEILEILLNEWTKLPKNYRMIVTTRPEQDIEDRCQSPGISCKRMGDIIDTKETRHDIKAYVSSRLASISSILDGIDICWRSTLAGHAQGLFQWAQTACGLIGTTVTRPQLIRENWETCVSSSSSSLYNLYHQVILNQPESRHPSFKEQFKAIVGAIVIAQEPLSIHALQNIFEDIENVRSILTPFGSFFSGVHDPSESAPVRPLHTSLFDFFMTEKISEKNQEMSKKINDYYIDTSNQGRMTLGCLKVMNRMLCFNICHLETSHLPNKKVPNFNSRVEKAIPSHLSYSCRFWAFHLQSSARSEELVREIQLLMDYNLLYYFEALSLLSVVERGCIAMRKIANWCKDVDGELAQNAIDAWDFGYDFGDEIAKSTPHLYLSALPFASRDSFVSRKYLERYPGLFTFDVGQPVGSSRKTRFTHKDAFGYPMTFAFSPKGTYYATGIYSKLFVWNYITGEKEATHPITIRTTGIVFSPDGETVYCFSMEGDILIWNMVTNEVVIEKYGEIIGAECDHGTISSDGRFITWFTEKEVLLFDRKSRQIIKRFESGYYSSSAISPNGEWVVLNGSWKEKMHIWNTRKQMQHVLPCHTRWDSSLALTDNYIAFKSDAKTIDIWDLRTNTRVIEIQKGTSVTSFCLSPDGQYIISTNKAYYSIWSVATGELISRSYEDGFQSCLGFSHDSKSIAFATYRDTIHVRQWDETIEPSPLKEIYKVDEAWLRGAYLILRYTTVSREDRLRISDITTTNTIIFEAELEERGCVGVSPDDENVRVAYNNSRGLCLWNDKEGEIVVDRSVRSMTALMYLDSYLISGQETIIKIWDSCTHTLVHGPIDLPCELGSLLPVRGTFFAVIHWNEVEVRDCESGDRVLGMSAFDLSSICGSAIWDSLTAVSANEKHIICMSRLCVDIFDLTGVKVNSFPLPRTAIPWTLNKQRSFNGKYLTWIDDNKLKLFDVDTETLRTVTDPSFNRFIWSPAFTNNSKCIITVSRDVDDWRDMRFDIWDIESKNTIIKTIWCGAEYGLTLSKRHIVSTLFRMQCHVWDLDTYETMSTLYGAHPLTTDNSNIEGESVSNKTKTLDYALVAWKRASLSPFTKMSDSSSLQVQLARHGEGWCLGPQGELLFWVPPKMRKQFWIPCTTHMPIQNIVKLNFTNFVHGLDWTKCRLGNH